MIRFGADGIRGRAGEEPCTVEVAGAIGWAAVQLGGQGCRVLIGRDTRPSGAELNSAPRTIAFHHSTGLRPGLFF